jgi:hypothetical protein
MFEIVRDSVGCVGWFGSLRQNGLTKETVLTERLYF